jgi:hypothetical protein
VWSTKRVAVSDSGVVYVVCDAPKPEGVPPIPDEFSPGLLVDGRRPVAPFRLVRGEKLHQLLAGDGKHPRLVHGPDAGRRALVAQPGLMCLALSVPSKCGPSRAMSLRVRRQWWPNRASER